MKVQILFCASLNPTVAFMLFPESWLLLPQVQVNGLTGLIKFDQEGFRRDVTLDIVELAKEALVKVGK